MTGSFVVGIIAGLSGGGGAGEPRFHTLDRDDFDDVLARLAPRAALALPFCPALDFAELAHFHPDELAARVPALAKLLEARDAVGDPPRMRRLIEESGASPALAPAPAPPEQAAPAPVETTEADLLDAIVSGRPLEGGVRVKTASADPEFDRVVREIAERSADPTDYAQQGRWRAAIDAELAARARAILRAPELQRLESAWRSLRALVWRAETGEELRIRALDLSRDALLEDAARPGDACLLHRLVVEEERGTPGGEPFGLLLVDHAFDAGDDDLRVLGHLAGVAERAEVPCVAALSPSFWSGEAIDWAGIEALTKQVRQLSGARRLALACPRVLLRLPYGPDADPVDRFAFDEGGDAGAVGLWGSPAYALAETVVEAVADFGRPVGLPRLALREDRVFHVTRRDGDVHFLGPTDRLLTDSETERLRELGIVPLAAVRGRDVLQVASFRSVTGEPLFPE